MLKWDEYDELIIKEIAAHTVNPNAIRKFLELSGKPIEKLMNAANSSQNKIMKKVSANISHGIEEGIRKTIKLANTLCSDESVINEYKKKNILITSIDDVRDLKLEQMDMVADSYDLNNALIVGVEGAVMGLAATLAESVPFAQFLIPSIILSDVAASMTLLSRHVCQIATSYGFSSQKQPNLPHILAAMTPNHNSSDEGFLAVKVIAIKAAQESGEFLIKNAGKTLEQKILEKEAPQLIKLITYLTERLGVVITEKELGMLVPIAGAVLNGGMNVAFQQVGHTTSKDYFRQLILEKKYGTDEFVKRLTSEINILQESAH